MASKTWTSIPLLLGLLLTSAVAEDPSRAVAPSPPAGAPPSAPVSLPPCSIGVRHPIAAITERGLRWLKAHQASDGSWNLGQRGRWCERKYDAAAALLQGRGQAKHDLAVTAQAVLAFLELGYTERGSHPYKSTIRGALRYLRSHANKQSGRFGSDDTHAVFAHALATEAFLRRYALDVSLVFKGPVKRGLGWLHAARNAAGVWRRRLGPGPADTRATWQAARVVFLAQEINRRQTTFGHPELLAVPGEGGKHLRAFLHRVTDAKSGRVAASPGATIRPLQALPKRSAPLEAMAAWMYQVLGSHGRDARILARTLSHVHSRPPAWLQNGAAIDLDYWLAGTQVMRRVGGAAFEAWRQALDRALVGHQRSQGTACRYLGSWDPLGVWGSQGGRVSATAMALRCLAAAHATR